MGLITALISVTLKAEQGISGIGIYLFGLGFSDLMFLKLVGTPLPINALNAIKIPLLDRIPAVGGMFFENRPSSSTSPSSSSRSSPSSSTGRPWAENQRPRREPGGGGQRRGERQPDPLVDRTHAAARWPGWPAPRF